MTRKRTGKNSSPEILVTKDSPTQAEHLKLLLAEQGDTHPIPSGREASAVDRVCRYAGDEIAIILPETDLETAGNVAERLRIAMEAQPFYVNAGVPVRIPLSIGVASRPTGADGAKVLVAAADTVQYVAKKGGRNRVVCPEPVPSWPGLSGMSVDARPYPLRFRKRTTR
ncbi:MAG: GGDEF domain-containing response regulator [Acidiferrobacterales bacterium]